MKKYQVATNPSWSWSRAHGEPARFSVSGEIQEGLAAAIGRTAIVRFSALEARSALRFLLEWFELEEIQELIAETESRRNAHARHGWIFSAETKKGEQ